MEFERAQEIEETFHKDFDGIDFTSRSTDGRTSLRISCEQFPEFSKFSELRIEAINGESYCSSQNHKSFRFGTGFWNAPCCLVNNFLVLLAMTIL